MREPSRGVFLSYASEDVEAARRVSDALCAGGIDVWFDESELRSGDEWDHRIRRQIRDCALFIPIISRNTQARPEGYFRLEWRLADQRTHSMAKGRAYLLPVCIDDIREADAEVPDSFQAVQWTHLRGGDTPLTFVQHVSRLLSGDAHGAGPNPQVTPVRGQILAPTSWATAQGGIPEKSIAVLPFVNLSGEKDSEYFSDGLAEEILNALSQVEELSVAARSSAFFFKGKGAEASEIARRLHVANLLEGSVRRSGNRVRVTVQLVDARNGFQLWSERYDRQMEDIFELQDDIARAITSRLKVTLLSGAKPGTSNLEAYELYLKGRHHWHQRSPATLRSAVQYFEQSIKLDPQYALAYAGLADCYAILNFYGWMPTGAARPRAHAAMAEAMALAPTRWECTFSRGFYIFYFEPMWRDAEQHFRKAITINPRSSLAHVYLGLFMTTAGREDEAVEYVLQACQLDPLAPIIHALASAAFGALGQFEPAERAARQALELQPDYIFGHWRLGLALLGLGRNDEGLEELERSVTLSRAPIFVGILGFGYARAGRPDDAKRLLRELEDRGARGEYIPAFAPLAIHVGSADVPAIRGALTKVIAEGAQQYTVRIMCSPFLEACRTDPEIDRLHHEMFGW
jgi:TolB-like protein